MANCTIAHTTTKLAADIARVTETRWSLQNGKFSHISTGWPATFRNASKATKDVATASQRGNQNPLRDSTIPNAIAPEIMSRVSKGYLT
jgi:hypothetical protein